MGRKLSEASRRKREREALDLEEARAKRQGPPPAPRGPEHVVDPAWVAAHNVTEDAIPEPFAAIGNLDIEHVHRALDPDIFPDGNGHVKRTLSRRENTDEPARDIGSAFEDFLEVISPDDADTVALIRTHGVAIKSLVLAIRRAVERALSDAEDARDNRAITRGFWEHHIAATSFYSDPDITPEEMIDAAFDQMDTVERTNFLDKILSRMLS